MWTLSGKVIDLYDDVNGDVLTSLDNGLLEKVASTPVCSQEDLDQLPDRAFALIIVDDAGKMHRKYPIHNEGHVRLAHACLLKHGSKLLPKMRNVASAFIKNACSLHGVETSDEVATWATKCDLTSNFVTIRSAEIDYLTNDVTRALTSPVKTAQTAEDPRDLLKNADIHAPAGDEFLAAIAKRASMIEDPGLKSALATFSEKLGSMTRREAFLVMTTIDKHAGLDRYWTRPGFLNIKEELLREKVASTKVGSYTVKHSDIIRLASKTEMLGGLFNDGLVSEFSTSPVEVFNALPHETQKYIVEEILPKVS